jgi:glycosyltransferase involved in cell wall biosynthesis
MHVLFLNCLYMPDIGGGAEITLHQLAVGLLGRGHTVTALCIGRGDRGLELDRVDGVKVYRAGIRNIYFPDARKSPLRWHRSIWHLIDSYNPMMRGYIREVVAAEKPEVASCHNIAGWSVSAWDALAGCGVPIVQVLHDQYLLCPASTMFDGHKPCVRQCPACRAVRLPHAYKSNRVQTVVGVSHFILDKLLDYGYFRDTPHREVVHNTRSLNGALPPEAGRADESEVVFGFIGTIAAQKGIELLLETFQRSASLDWRLIVAGTGRSEYEQALKNRFRSLRISFSGFMDAGTFFSMIDVSVVPSLWEDTFPGVVLESLMYGVPVIGSGRGGIPEMLEPEKNGLLFDPDEPDGLQTAMEHMAGEIDGWRARKEKIIEGFRTYSDATEWLRKWEDIYERVV